MNCELWIVFAAYKVPFIESHPSYLHLLWIWTKALSPPKLCNSIFLNSKSCLNLSRFIADQFHPKVSAFATTQQLWRRRDHKTAIFMGTMPLLLWKVNLHRIAEKLATTMPKYRRASEMRFSQWLFMRPLGPLWVYLAFTPAAVLRSTSTSSVKGQCFFSFQKVLCIPKVKIWILNRFEKPGHTQQYNALKRVSKVWW